MADPRLEVIEVPQKGSFSWPGRDNLDERTRVLLESRTLKELAYATENLSLSATLLSNNRVTLSASMGRANRKPW